MASVTGLTVIKRFTYRDDPNEEFCNTYHFKNPPPGDDASWLVVLNDVVSHELPILSTATAVVRAYGYDSDDPAAHHVFQHDFTSPGPPPTGGNVPTGTEHVMAGDQAALCEWRLDRLSKTGKPIYLRKYFHDGTISATVPDRLADEYITKLEAFIAPTGIQSVHGGLRSRSSDDNVVAGAVLGWVTTRTLKRRGKRPRPGA